MTAVVQRRIVAGLLAAMAVANAVLVERLWSSSVVVAVLCGVLAVAALVVALLVVVGRRQADLLAALVVGALGVATFLVSAVAALAAGTPMTGLLGGWPIGAFLLDGLVARLAAVALRREARA